MTARITLYKGGDTKAKITQPVILINQLLAEYNFKEAGSCNCGGIYTLKYQNDKFLLRVRPRRNQHQLSYRGNGNSGITNWVTLSELKTKLDELI